MSQRSSSVLTALVILLLVACGGSTRAESAATSGEQFGPVLASVDEIIGTELTANSVVSLPCIPSRRDPVGVWLSIQVHDAQVEDDAFTLALEATDARLGSHPSGCSNPETLVAQSVFLFDGDEPVFASSESTVDDIVTLTFALQGRPAADLDVVVLPTFAFNMGDGNRQTTIFGLIGKYSLA